MEISKNEIAQADSVFSEFKKVMSEAQHNVPYGISRFEVPQVVGMVRELGLRSSMELMGYAVRNWDTLKATTGSDGQKLLDNPNFNQIVAYWRPRIWNARMKGIPSKRQKSSKAHVSTEALAADRAHNAKIVGSAFKNWMN
jgi:hypothetical protein